MSTGGHRRDAGVIWRQRAMIGLGVLVLVVGAFTLVDYYRFTTCQQSVNEVAFKVNQIRGQALERSLDAQIAVAQSRLKQEQTGDRNDTVSTLQTYVDALQTQRQVRDAFSSPEPAQCR